MDSRYFFAFFLTVLSAFTASIAADTKENRFFIDLQKFPLYVKANFKHSDAVSPDLQDGSWTVKDKWYGAVVRRLGLPGLPKRIFLSPWGRPEREWTFVIPFTMEASLLEASGKDGEIPVVPCLYLATIGINWEIYLNGTVIKKEMHLADGHILEQHYERYVIVPINSSLLRKDKNILAFRIVGDPTDYTTGFTYKFPYYIADFDYVTRKHNETVQIIIISILAILGIFHFMFSAIFRENRHNMACGVFTFGMGLYYFWRTRWIHQIIPNSDIVMRFEYFTLYFMILALMAYTDKLCNERYFIVTKLYGVLCVVLAVSQLFFSRTYGSEAAGVWQVASIMAIIWIYFYNLVIPFNRELKKGKKITDALVNTYPGNLLISFTIFGLAVVFDLIDSLAMHYSFNFTKYGMVIISMTVTFMLFRISVIKDKELKKKSALLEKTANPASVREKIFNSYGLTEREKEIARLMVEGLDNTEIGERIFLSNSTIAFHVTNIFRKFGIIDGKNKGRAMFLAKLLN